MKNVVMGAVSGIVAMLAIPANAQHAELDQCQLLAEDYCTYGDGMALYNNDYYWCVQSTKDECERKTSPGPTCYYDGKLCVWPDAPGVNPRA